MMDRCRPISEERRPVDHLDRGDVRTLEGDVHGLQSDSAQCPAANADGCGSFLRRARTVCEIRGSQERVPFEPAGVVVNEVKDGLARRRNDIADFAVSHQIEFMERKGRRQRSVRRNRKSAALRVFLLTSGPKIAASWAACGYKGASPPSLLPIVRNACVP